MSSRLSSIVVGSVEMETPPVVSELCPITGFLVKPPAGELLTGGCMVVIIIVGRIPVVNMVRRVEASDIVVAVPFCRAFCLAAF